MQRPSHPYHDREYTDTVPIPNIPNHDFTSVGGNVTQLSLTSYGESGMDLLYRFVTIEALHNSGERFPEPACHPGTRTEILGDLRAWSIDTTPESTILWLHGPAGVGKSAIAQMFAGNCRNDGRLGASFFFRRGHRKRGTWHNLFTTISYQLAASVPGLLLPIQQTVEDDKLVVGLTMAVQFQRLIVEPLKSAPASELVPIIVLDGLEECEDHKIQQQILQLFIGAIYADQLPIRILITGRPEPHIREVFETETTSTICCHFEISSDSAAIEIYLRDEFSRIRSEFRARGIDLGPVWPPVGALDHLVRKSSGIFIYAATVIRYVEDEYSHPADRLQSVLSLDPQSTAPLDDLYTEILSVLPQEPKQLRILYALWQGTLAEGVKMDPEHIDMLLDLRPGMCRLALRGLHSLLHVPSPPSPLAFREVVYFLHASFVDYLSDARRSGSWCVSVAWLESDYLQCMIRVVSRVPSRDHGTSSQSNRPQAGASAGLQPPDR
ncbi:hypothetical protein B0H11DRAFT_2238445 [Mycena galericulata]|nr:hypothetical protein B0H11DRAFT_2238445 [Mycena galericulata]